MNMHRFAVTAVVAFTATLADAAAPTSAQELQARLAELRAYHEPFLRSLPPPLPARVRTPLPAEWLFTYEAKASPKTEGIPPAPAWHGIGFDASAWERTTVPEWRYRTREGDDTARNPEQVSQWKNTETSADTICWYRTTFAAAPAADGTRTWLCFDGVEWEAQVWLNGEPLGTHRVYYEPFRFDVTGKLQPTNTLAVRVISGRSYGQPVSYWGLFPDIRAARQRYTPDRAQSIPGNLPIGYHAGCGFGIFRDVYLEQTGPIAIRAVFARNDLGGDGARVRVEIDPVPGPSVTAQIDILPENFEGPAYSGTATVHGNDLRAVVPMPGARIWSPEAPHLYRCRVRIAGSDAMDVLFGCRSFALHQAPRRAGPPVYRFPSVAARHVRILGRGSDASAWNSIWEIECAARPRNGAVTASRSHTNYPAALAVDGKGDTRWAVEGRGEWIQVDLDPAVAFDRIGIGWFEAEHRAWDFDLLVSDDGQAWRELAYAREGGEAGGLPDGMPLLNGRPTRLRGTNVQGFNLYAYWGQTNELINALMLLKAANFNIVRSCQHIEFPEVLELMDRTGLMSEQDQGGGYHGSIDMGIRRDPHIHTGTVMARQTYNHPGVVLLSFGNEHEFPTEPIVRAARAVDSQRIFKPISGRFSHSKKPWDLPADLRPFALDDGHPYAGWYGNVVAQTWSNLVIHRRDRMVTLGEYGAEALDAYETMRDSYPPRFRPPPPETDTLWAASQVQKRDVKQIAGLGRAPTNLAEYIEASQGYQEALVADKTIGMRLSPRAIAGYFHFHFLDVVPVFWPKSVVSHDHRPKMAYYQLAQINQPLVPLPQFTGARPDGVRLWIANDLDTAMPGALLRWHIRAEGTDQVRGEQRIDVPPVSAVPGPTLDLVPVTSRARVFDLELTLADAQGRPISRYVRTIRVVADASSGGDPKAGVADPFNKAK